MHIRRIRPGDGPLLREIRLAALAEAPYAFASSLAAESNRPLQQWEERAGAGAAGEAEVGLFAFEGERAVAMAEGYFDDVEGESDAVHLIAMWVAPGSRGRGLGRALTDAVVDWARERGARLVKLWVTTTNTSAIGLYERCGFRRTDQVEPLPSDPSLTVVRMEREP